MLYWSFGFAEGEEGGDIPSDYFKVVKVSSVSLSAW